MATAPLSRTTSLAKSAARRLPFTAVEPFAFPRESFWYRTRRPPRTVDEPSVVLFTLHKVASTFTHVMIEHLNQKHMKLRRIDWDRYLYNRFQSGTTELLTEKQSELFLPRGYLYGPMRATVPIDNLGAYRTLLILRDPRDILTSLFYSMAFSHSSPLNAERRKSFEAERDWAAAQSIDEFVLAKSSHLQGLLSDYQRLSDRWSIPPLLYRDMMLDWPKFMDLVGAQLDIEIPEHDREHLRQAGQIGADHGDDVTAHRRKGTPGDHQEKLQPATVAQLNDIFGNELQWLGLL